jgi:Na+-transporting NADH:ubiquinone oxidoreductase subunit NqrB
VEGEKEWWRSSRARDGTALLRSGTEKFLKGAFLRWSGMAGSVGVGSWRCVLVGTLVVVVAPPIEWGRLTRKLYSLFLWAPSGGR